MWEEFFPILLLLFSLSKRYSYYCILCVFSKKENATTKLFHTIKIDGEKYTLSKYATSNQIMYTTLMTLKCHYTWGMFQILSPDTKEAFKLIIIESLISISHNVNDRRLPGMVFSSNIWMSCHLLMHIFWCDLTKDYLECDWVQITWKHYYIIIITLWSKCKWMNKQKIVESCKFNCQIIKYNTIPYTKSLFHQFIIIFSQQIFDTLYQEHFLRTRCWFLWEITIPCWASRTIQCLRKW